MTDVRKLYCDESGFTGPDLLNRDQKYFCYSSVLIDPSHAAELVTKVRVDHKLQGDELKGSQLLKNSRGRKAALQIFEAAYSMSVSSMADKRFSLAGKLYE